MSPELKPSSCCSGVEPVQNARKLKPNASVSHKWHLCSIAGLSSLSLITAPEGRPPHLLLLCFSLNFSLALADPVCGPSVFAFYVSSEQNPSAPSLAAVGSSSGVCLGLLRAPLRGDQGGARWGGGLHSWLACCLLRPRCCLLIFSSGWTISRKKTSSFQANKGMKGD